MERGWYKGGAGSRTGWSTFDAIYLWRTTVRDTIVFGVAALAVVYLLNPFFWPNFGPGRAALLAAGFLVENMRPLASPAAWWF